MIINPIELANCAIAKVEINGARLLSMQLAEELTEALDRAEELDETRALLLHVVGDIGPVSDRLWPGRTDIQSVSRWERALRRLERTDLVTIALVEGACSALALELLLVVDRRISCGNFCAAHTCEESNVWPGMALYRLSRQIGEARARRLYLDATPITTTMALELNVVDETVDDFTTGLARIGHFLKVAPVADFAVRRRLMQESLSTSFDEALGAHLAACDRAIRRSQ
jgi:isomerase DpgB